MKLFRILIILLLGATFTGCAKQVSAPKIAQPRGDTTLSTSEAPVAVISNTDPCASRLHDISGAFMLYIAVRNDLPASLSELKNVSDEELVLTCPVSNQPYVYTPGGLLLPEQQARIVLYDPAPSHKGYRQAIAIADPVPGKALVTKIVAIAESFFLLHPPENNLKR